MIVPGSYIQQGEAVGSFISASLERKLATLNGELAVAEASLKLLEQGEKSSIIQDQ